MTTDTTTRPFTFTPREHYRETYHEPLVGRRILRNEAPGGPKPSLPEQMDLDGLLAELGGPKAWRSHRTRLTRETRGAASSPARFGLKVTQRSAVVQPDEVERWTSKLPKYVQEGGGLIERTLLDDGSTLITATWEPSTHKPSLNLYREAPAWDATHDYVTKRDPELASQLASRGQYRHSVAA